MAEYISREAAIKRFNFAVLDCLGMEPTIRAGDIIKALESIPAADVRPVVRGHKVTHNRPIAGYWASGKLDGGLDGMEGRVWVEPIMDNPVDYCSECGKRLDDTFQNFCPNCGADMRETNNEEA